MRIDKNARIALRNGRAQADEVHRRRIKALRRKAKAVSGQVEVLTRTAVLQTANLALLQGIAAAGSKGLLIAEGDSWFDYQRWACEDDGTGTDLIAGLRDMGYEVPSVAHRGDKIQDMAYSDGQLTRFSQKVEEQLSNHRPIKAILLCGGGNDVVEQGKFGLLLNHARSPQPGLNDQVVNSLIDDKLRNAYLHIIGAITQLWTKWLGQPVPILVHGYDFPVPDGTGHCSGWSGPWMGNEFHNHGYDNLNDRKALIKEIIVRFNRMLSRLPALDGLGHVKHVDLTGSLPTGSNFKDYWENELHPTPKGFGLLTARFAGAL